ncbi:hypothetical protein RDABS01_001043 [Bienertia sinuspersici]
MGGGNAQKSKTARERNLEKNKAAKGSQLDSNKKAMNIQLDQILLEDGDRGAQSRKQPRIRKGASKMKNSISEKR